MTQSSVFFMSKSKALRDEGEIGRRPGCSDTASLRRHGVFLFSPIPHSPPQFFHHVVIARVSSKREAPQDIPAHFTGPRGTHLFSLGLVVASRARNERSEEEPTGSSLPGSSLRDSSLDVYDNRQQMLG